MKENPYQSPKAEAPVKGQVAGVKRILIIFMFWVYFLLSLLIAILVVWRTISFEEITFGLWLNVINRVIVFPFLVGCWYFYIYPKGDLLKNISSIIPYAILGYILVCYSDYLYFIFSPEGDNYESISPIEIAEAVMKRTVNNTIMLIIQTPVFYFALKYRKLSKKKVFDKNSS